MYMYMYIYMQASKAKPDLWSQVTARLPLEGRTARDPSPDAAFFGGLTLGKEPVFSVLKVVLFMGGLRKFRASGFENRKEPVCRF